MQPWVVEWNDAGQAALEQVGGKGRNLAMLRQIEGVQVPDGFSVTTAAYNQAVEHQPMYRVLLDELAQLTVADLVRGREVSRRIRELLLDTVLPDELIAAVSASLSRFAARQPFAVRSSATAEDLPDASFAGQQESYLHVIGQQAVLAHIRHCWASLFTERAVIYRMQQGIDHRQVSLSVIIQRMVSPQASGIAFTADPLTSNRKLVSIDAGWGLGEAMVSGIVSADNYTVKDEKIVAKRIASKTSAIYGLAGGGTETQQIEAERQTAQTLTDAQIIELSQLARRIEVHFGCPQDIEWCLDDQGFHIVQSRPITTLFPIPEAKEEEQGEKRVYLSVGHQQMMTDPIRPLGLSFFLMTTAAPMRVAGGRLFVDCTQQLRSPVRREMLLRMMGQSDPLFEDAMRAALSSGDIPLEEDASVPAPAAATPPASTQTGGPAAAPEAPRLDASVVAELIAHNEASVARLSQTLQRKAGIEALDYIHADIQELKGLLFDPPSSTVIHAAMNAATWINTHILEWLGEPNAVDVLSQSVPGNVTSEMGLALMDVADAIRPYPEAVAVLERTDNDNSGNKDNFLEELATVAGGQEARQAIQAYLQRYGMRCPGEIDLTRPRWREQPAVLVPMLLSHLHAYEPGESRRRFEAGQQRAAAKEQELLERVRKLPDGDDKASELEHRIRLVRDLSGYREYPKYGMVSRYDLYKQAILREADRLVQAQVLDAREDVYDLTFEELCEVVRTHRADAAILRQRRADYKRYARLEPPRVITSDGEIYTGAYWREDLPEGALPGLAVSAGVIEGRARVMRSMDDGTLEASDILVTAFTDPGWTPLFVSVAGLITEVGGRMTHGAVIAREYGLPAVVGVEGATTRIRDGQHIRLHGTSGYVELL